MNIRYNYHLCILALPLVGLMSCAGEENAGRDGSGCDVVQITTTRASADFPNAFVRANEAYTPAAGTGIALKYPTTGKTGYTTYTYTTDGSSVGSWSLSGGQAPLYWDDLSPTGGAYSFFALAPATHAAAQKNADAGRDVYYVSFTQHHLGTQTEDDLLVAYTAAAARQPVAFNLTHPLAKLRVRLSRAAGISLDLRSTILSIVSSDLSNGYRLSFQPDAAAPAIATVAPKADNDKLFFWPCPLVGATPDGIIYELLLPPGQNATLTMSFRVHNPLAPSDPASPGSPKEDTYTYTATLVADAEQNNALVAGCVTVFDLTIDGQRLVPGGVTLQPWELLPGEEDIPTFVPDPDVAYANGMSSLYNQPFFDRNKPKWIIVGGGSEKIDSIVCRNVGEGETGGLMQLMLPDVKSTPLNAFLGINFSRIDLPAATKIGNGTFWNCLNLRNVNLPLVEEIDEDAFSFCSSLDTVTLPAVKKLGVGVFAGCVNLAIVELPAVEEIGTAAFLGCNSLDRITLGGPNVRVAMNAFLFTNCDLVLNEDQRPFVQENQWNGSIWRSITFLP